MMCTGILRVISLCASVGALLALLVPVIGLCADLPTSLAKPIPVFSIFPPLQPNGSADDALASGKVEESNFAFAAAVRKRWRVAFLFPHLKDPYWSACAYGVVTEARRLGMSVSIMAAAGYHDLRGQLQLMDKAIEEKFDAIVISPIDMTANNRSIAKARSAGIPVFQLANDSRSDDLIVKVTSSLREMGVQATEWVIRDAHRRGLRTVNLGLLPGPNGAGWVKGEVDGTRIAALKASIQVNIIDIKYGDSDESIQARLAGEMLAKHGRKLDYILGCTGCAPAAVQPLRHAGLQNHIRIVAYDLTGEIADLIRARDIAAAVDTKAVSQARVVINTVAGVLEGRSPSRPHTILVKLGLVDRINFDTYPFDASIAPRGYKAVLAYDPARPD